MSKSRSSSGRASSDSSRHVLRSRKPLTVGSSRVVVMLTFSHFVPESNTQSHKIKCITGADVVGRIVRKGSNEMISGPTDAIKPCFNTFFSKENYLGKRTNAITVYTFSFAFK